jgi:acyl carrier protein
VKIEDIRRRRISMNTIPLGKDALRVEILSSLAEVFKNQYPGQPIPDISDMTILLKTGLDSLGFAVLVSQLEDRLGFDPFTLSTEAYYPKTFGEFLDYYYGNQPK